MRRWSWILMLLNKTVNMTGTVCVTQVCSTFYMMQASSKKFGLPMGNMKFSMRYEEWINICTIICIFLASVIVC
jgi:hypothetical protein